MQQPISLITAKLTEITHPLTNQPFNPITDISEMHYEADKLIISFVFAYVQSPAFRVFQRTLLQILKQDLQIPHIQLHYEQAEPALQATPMTQLFPNASFIALSANDLQVDTAARIVSLAKQYAKSGKKVAIIDADVRNSSIPLLLQINKNPPQISGSKVHPFTKKAIAVISTSLLTPDNKPMLWREEMIENLLQQFLYDVTWDRTTDIFLFNFPYSARQFLPKLALLLPEIKIEVLSNAC